MKEKLQRFLAGRYGQDALNRALTVVSLLLYLLSLVFRWMPLSYIAIFIMLFTLYRMLSKNIARRRREAAVYNRLVGNIKPFFSRIKSRFSQRKTHRYYKCPTCHKEMRVPKGRGRISITCPQCHHTFEKKT